MRFVEFVAVVVACIALLTLLVGRPHTLASVRRVPRGDEDGAASSNPDGDAAADRAAGGPDVLRDDADRSMRDDAPTGSDTTRRESRDPDRRGD